MTAIDCTDCYLAIAMGDGVRRALVRHFGRFIGEQLAARDFAPRDENAGDKIDRDAWRLATRVLNEVETELQGALDETLLVPDPQKSAQDILASVVAASVADIEEQYLADALLGFEALLSKLHHAGLDIAPRT
jgi:hypothetical protein